MDDKARRTEVFSPAEHKVPFKALTHAEIARIVDLMVADLRARLTDHRIPLEITSDARASIARRGFGPVFSARPPHRNPAAIHGRRPRTGLT